MGDLPRLIPKLTRLEREFLISYMDHRCNGTEAWLAVRPNVKRESASQAASRMLSRLKSKIGWGALLEHVGLDDYAIASNLRRLLTVQRPVHYQGEEVGLYDDGGTQLRATEFLAELRGRKHAERGEVEKESVVVYIPDNGRGDGD